MPIWRNLIQCSSCLLLKMCKCASYQSSVTMSNKKATYGRWRQKKYSN